jgi:hypothetical protein
VLKATSERERRRNVWILGGVAARRVLSLRLVIEPVENKAKEQTRLAIVVMANYIVSDRFGPG